MNAAALAPGAAQAEVARRIGDGPLADLVRATPLAGRGPVDGTGTGDRDLLRVCVSVLARIAELDASPAARPARERRRWFARPAPAVIPVGPLDAMALAHWRARVERGAGMRWRRVWEGYVARDVLPRELDPHAQEEILVRLAGGRRVSWVYAPPPVVDPVATDLLRRLNQVLATRSADVRRRPYDGVLAGRFDRPDAAPLGVPAFALPWAVREAERLAERLASCWPAEPARARGVVPSTDERPRGVPAAAALDRALSVLAALAEEGQPWRGR